MRRIVVHSPGRADEVTTPKTEISHRSVTTTADVVEVFRLQERRVGAHRQRLGDAWIDTDEVFTHEVGTYRDAFTTRGRSANACGSTVASR